MVRVARLAARESDDELFSLSRASFDSYARGRAAIASGEINDATATVAMQLAQQNLITKDEAMRLIPFD